jgi:MFS transporter, BCD family, chlorophyll transporter
MSGRAPMGWAGTARLGLVQAALGGIVVLATSTMNRVMTVELALPAVLPGALVALHYAVQVVRPRMGHGSDVGGRRTPWIVGGMALLAAGAVAAALAIGWTAQHPVAGILLAVLAYAAIGVGVGTSGTALLALLAEQVRPDRRPAAATLVWIMMILGIAVTAGAASRCLDPFSPARLLAVTATVAAIALALTILAVWGVEDRAPGAALPAAARPAFARALAQVWADAQARRFTLFVFVSMLAYSAQELVLEPFAGAVFGLTPGATAGLTGLQHAGALCGMLLVAVAGSVRSRSTRASMRLWTVGGCLASAAMLVALAATGLAGPVGAMRAAVLGLGLANGAFAVSAIGAMMQLAGADGRAREGVRIGLWGAAQALAFAAGGLIGTAGSDLARGLLGSPAAAFAAVFAAEAGLFLLAAVQAARVFRTRAARAARPARQAGRRQAVLTGEG